MEHVVVIDDGEIIYGNTGFVEVTRPNEQNRIAPVVYSFKKFKIPTPAVFTYERETRDSGTCRPILSLLRLMDLVIVKVKNCSVTCALMIYNISSKTTTNT